MGRTFFWFGFLYANKENERPPRQWLSKLRSVNRLLRRTSSQRRLTVNRLCDRKLLLH